MLTMDNTVNTEQKPFDVVTEAAAISVIGLVPTDAPEILHT